MKNFTTYTEAEERAIELGAVEVGVYYPAKNSGAFSAHFFDADGLEIGFYHYDLNEPLLELIPRRAWHSSFLAGLEFSNLESHRGA